MQRVLGAVLALALAGLTILTFQHPGAPNARGYVGLHDEDPNGVRRGVMEIGWAEGDTETTVLQLFPGEFQVAVQQDGAWAFPLQGTTDGVIVVGDLRVTGRLYLGEAGYLYAEDGHLYWSNGDVRLD